MLPNFRSKQGTFVKAYRGVRRTNETKQGRKGGEKAAKDATERGFRHVLRTERVYFMVHLALESSACLYDWYPRIAMIKDPIKKRIDPPKVKSRPIKVMQASSTSELLLFITLTYLVVYPIVCSLVRAGSVYSRPYIDMV